MTTESIQPLTFISPETFANTIEQIVSSCNGGTTYIEAVLSYCDRNDIEPDQIGNLISDALKKKIQYEAESFNFLKKTGTKLPL